MAEGQYRIVKAQLPLLGGLAGHNFLVLIDPAGKIVGELHGLATDAEGHPKPIGHLPSDELKGMTTSIFTSLILLRPNWPPAVRLRS
jgi:hypothetical protein